MSGRGRFGGNPTGAARPLDWLWIWLCLCDPSGMPENGSATMLTARQPAVRVVGFFYGRVARLVERMARPACKRHQLS
ncbi:MAG: hypothetical protein K0S42_461 [Microvirga sp.]|jgi:hypothetical protein|nr:hypothetical protein [Microvirga sp.]